MTAEAPVLFVTRPEPAAGRSVVRLRALGWTVHAAPALAVRAVPLEAPLPGTNDSAPPDAIIATSANALLPFGAQGLPDALCARPAFAVGAKTAAALTEAGASDVTTGKGKAADLLPFILDHVPKGGRVLYLRAREISFDMRAALAAEGRAMDERITYEAAPAQTLPDEVARAWREAAHACTLFYSARAVMAFAELAPMRAQPAAAFCLSPAIAREAEKAGYDPVHCAAAPNEDALIAVLHAAF